ncbi:MAG: universal stress protein [Bacteroidetes bacterium]|nr:universal stress protein [Bacteroidota bacterium]
MKILAPTDFSPLSRVAVSYAVSLANKLNAELTLIHLVHVDSAHASLAVKNQ